MKKLLLLVLLLTLALLLSGCFLLPAQRYDGSEQYYEAHPEQKNTPEYMQPGDRHSDGS